MPKNENDSAADEFDVSGKPGETQEQAGEGGKDAATPASSTPAAAVPVVADPPAADPNPEPPKKADPFANKVFTDLPKCLRKSLAILTFADALPERNSKEEQAKAKILGAVRKHVFALQQGSIAPQVDANAIAAASVQQAAFIKSERMKMLARENRDVAELIAECERLTAEVAKLTKKK